MLNVSKKKPKESTNPLVHFIFITLLLLRKRELFESHTNHLHSLCCTWIYHTPVFFFCIRQNIKMCRKMCSREKKHTVRISPHCALGDFIQFLIFLNDLSNIITRFSLFSIPHICGQMFVPITCVIYLCLFKRCVWQIEQQRSVMMYWH